MEFVSEHPFGSAGLFARMHRLSNGLKILVVRDPIAPIFAYQTWFRVGSRHEQPGRTGLAHLFEHLMFNETESHGPGEFDRLLETAGGETNAATWVDWTYYRNNLPRQGLELVVGLEAERMARLVVREPQVNSEREVVANERRFRVEDDVDGFLSEQLFKHAFTAHPYHWPTIGWMQDIFAITTEDAMKFYRTFYAPNNATLVVVGDIDEAATLGLIEQKYGDIPAQELPPEQTQPEPAQTRERREIFQRPIVSDRLEMGYKSPPMSDPDFPTTEILCELLVGGNSSRLYRKLIVDKEVASSIHASPAPFRDPGLFTFSVTMKRGHGFGAAEQLIQEELERVQAEGVSARDLSTAKARLETRFWSDLRPGSGKAEALGHFETTCGDYRRLFGIADAYRSVTPEDVARVASRLFQRERLTVIAARPA